MRSGDLPRFMAAMATMGANWRCEVPQSTVDLFFAKFADLDIAQFESLCSRAIDSLEYFPNVAQLRRLANGSDAVKAADAWAAVLRCIRSNVKLPDDPAREFAVRSLGGWSTLRYQDCERLHGYTRRDFERIYAAYDGAPAEQRAAIEAPPERRRLTQPEDAGSVVRKLLNAKEQAS